MKAHVVKSYFNTSKDLVQAYIEESSKKFIPLAVYLKAYYKKNAKYGKRDRNAINDLVYAFFRVGDTMPSNNVEQRILAGAYLCNHKQEGIYAFISEFELSGIPYEPGLSDRIKSAPKFFPEFNGNKFLPYEIEFSKGIDKAQYFESFLNKPNTFIRLLEKHRQSVLAQLKDEGIEYEELQGFPNALKILSSKNLQELSAWKKGYFEIQDLSSQQIVNNFDPKPNDEWWDVCAASGGKSLLLLSKERNIFILATDNRKSILQNYTERLKRLNFLNFETKLMDASQNINMQRSFDGIICDVPCTGSGTWHRTPENLFFFNLQMLQEFSSLQKQIIYNSSEHLKQSKNLIYITCSVFKEENETISGSSELHKLNNGIINNFSLGADAMFVAKFFKG